MLDRTKTDLVEINAFRKLFWGPKTKLLLLATDPSTKQYRLLLTLTKDWMCDEVHKEKDSQTSPQTNARNAGFTIGDRKGSLEPILKKVEVFEINGKRWRIKQAANAPLDIRRIWKWETVHNSQDKTAIVP